jgi:hypothetical protein
VTEPLDGVVGGESTAPNLNKQFFQRLGVHGLQESL